MDLAKNDPVYYKSKFKELLKQASENGVKVSVDDNRVSFSAYSERASVEIKKEVCSACSGSGHYKSGKCGACNGTGFEID